MHKRNRRKKLIELKILCYIILLNGVWKNFATHDRTKSGLSDKISLSFPMALCTICMTDLNDHKVDQLYCGHSFHCDCIHMWFEQSDTCPMCRTGGVGHALTEPPMDLSMYTPLEINRSPLRIRRVVTKSGRKITILSNENKVKLIVRK